MPKNPHADFTPTLAGYSGITPFRFWCQTALPLTYDDSLSYYELLNKVVNYLNYTIEDLTNVENNTSELAEAYDKLQEYVNDYFDDIDIEAELRNVLDGMEEDGTLDALLNPLVENQLPGVVDEKIDAVVAGQIDNAVAGQIDESVADQLPTLVDASIPEEVSKWLEENVDPVGSAVIVDSTLTISGAAADAKVTGDELRVLKTEINGGTTVNYIPDKNIDSTTGAIIDATDVSVSEKIPYTWSGATKYYCGDNTQTIYGVAFYNSSDTLIKYFRNPYSTGGDSYREINAESQGASGAAYVRFSFLKGYTAYVTNVTGSITRYTAGSVTVEGLKNRVSTLESDIEDLNSDIDDLETADSKLSDDILALESTTTATVTKTEEIENDVWTDGYITLGGTVNASTSYVYSEEIDVEKDDIIRTSSRARFITAYYDGSAVELKGAEETDEYTVPDGVDSIIITLRAANTKIITKTYTATENSLTGRVEALERTVNKAGNSITAKATTITNDTIKALESVDTRKNMDIDFRANISAFTSVTVGHGYMINYGAWAVVDSTNVTIYADQNGTQIAQYPHGLTITHYIHVLIQQGDNTSATIIVESDSGRFKQENVVFDSRRGDFFATINGTLTDVVLTAVLKDLSKNIWMFGDSYQSLGSANRYPYYMKEDGYLNNCLMSGFPGANATHQIASFRKLIKISTPKFVVWCMGMNGSDSSSAINADWKACTDEVIATCEVKGVTVILATIPNVPDRIQTFKNDYVEESGERYINFAKAVGAESSGSTWYSGMLSSDNLHPSATGAIALYSELLADFPEIME